MKSLTIITTILLTLLFIIFTNDINVYINVNFFTFILTTLSLTTIAELYHNVFN